VYIFLRFPCILFQHIYISYIWKISQSQWPRGLRRRFSATLLLRWWVWISPGAWMSVCCECCVLSGRGLCDGLITRPGGVLPTVARRCVWSRNLENKEAKARYRAVKIQPQWVVTPGKQTNKHIWKNKEMYKLTKPCGTGRSSWLTAPFLVYHCTQHSSLYEKRYKCRKESPRVCTNRYWATREWFETTIFSGTIEFVCISSYPMFPIYSYGNKWL